jgi:hypothetical protein
MGKRGIFILELDFSSIFTNRIQLKDLIWTIKPIKTFIQNNKAKNQFHYHYSKLLVYKIHVHIPGRAVMKSLCNIGLRYEFICPCW